MKAIQISQYGDTGVFTVATDAPKPAIGAGMVLREVHAVSINPVDTAIRLGVMAKMALLYFPATIGMDAPESMGFTLNPGNNVYINLEPGTRAEAARIFTALSAGGEVEMELQEMFWGEYYGSLVDKYGVRWMINFTEKK
jgi:NADPH:quinone reductase-like Zn-dependent oxidoreductase